MEHWDRQLPRLATFIGRPEQAKNPVVQQNVQKFLDRKLRHHATLFARSADDENLPPSERAAAIAQRIYVALQQCDPAQHLDMDQQFKAGLDLLNPILEEQRRIHQRWQQQAEALSAEIVRIVPPAETYILVDDNQSGCQHPADRHMLPFLERDGEYHGPPADDQAAYAELDRLHQKGANFIVFAWPSFWWLKQYPTFYRNLQARYRCLVRNETLLGFDLRTPAAKDATQTKAAAF